MIKDSDQQRHPAEQGQMDCAVTAAGAMEVRADAVLLLLLGAAQTVMAMAAFAGTSRVCTICALILSMPMAYRVPDVLVGVLRLAIGRCHGHGFYHQELVTGYIVIYLSFVLLFFYGGLVAIRGKVDG